MSNDPYNDGTSTLNAKLGAMNGSIDLSLPAAARSMRRHRQARTRLIVACVALAVVLALALRWAWRVWA